MENTFMKWTPLRVKLTSGEAGVQRNFQKSSSKAMEGWELVSHEGKLVQL